MKPIRQMLTVRKDLESQALTQALHTKDLYLEAYSRRENIKFNNIREEVEREDTEEVLRNFLENEILRKKIRGHDLYLHVSLGIRTAKISWL